MHELHYQNKIVTIAQEWNELDGRKLIQLMEVLHRGRTRLQQQVEALRILCGKSKIVFFMLRPDVIEAFLPYTAWAFEANTLTQQLLPMYDELYGPAEELKNLRMKEFHYTELYYKNYQEEEKAEDLNSLIATLYRPAQKGHPAADVRVPFAEPATAAYAKRVGQWPLALRLAILHWYDGCRQQIIDTYDIVFAEGAESTDDEKAAYGMYGLMMELAGEKLGTVQNVEEMYVHSAMASLELQILKAREIEAQMPKA